MPRSRPQPLRLHPAHPAAVTPVRVDPAGRTGPTPKQARGPAWRSTAAGLYVPTSVDPDLPVQRIAEAAAVLPAYGGVTGWAALHWLGARWFDGLSSDGRIRRRVALAIGPGNLRPDRLRKPTKERLAPGDLTVSDGLPMTTVLRSVCFEARHAGDERRAVVALDMACHADLVSLAEMRAYAEEWLASWTGVPQLRAALDLADENAWSPQEVLTRLQWTLDAGLARPLTNRPVFDLEGNHLATPDLIDPGRGIVGEYDGADHLDARRRHRDLGREERLRAAGLELVVQVAGDRRDPAAYFWRLRSACMRAARRPASERRYTLELPADWVPTHTVEQRRSLRRVRAA
ncbi:hypothetical protein [Nocardioides marmotae]|uniref:hypothetical protein n=1 Tax=Nocardioides marmotae TaxID=2663857 RepID=UPI0020A644BB|nr:hypothetical protein [Nocardioides marmotae]